MPRRGKGGVGGGNQNVLLAFQQKYLFLSYCPIADYLKQHSPQLEQVCWSQQKVLLAPPRASCSRFPTASPMAYPSLRPCSLKTTDVSLMSHWPTVFRATWGTVRGNFLYKNGIWLGQSRQISALTSIEILPERQPSCRLDLSGVISPWCPVDEYFWLLLLLVFGKDHNLFLHSLALSSFLQLHMMLTWTTPPANNRFLSDQCCVKSLGHKYLVLLLSVCGQSKAKMGSPQQKCGELDHGLQFLYVM